MLLSLIPTFLDACLDASIRPIRPPCTHLSIPCLAPHIREGTDCVEAQCPHHSWCKLCCPSSGRRPSTSILTSIKSEIGLFVWTCLPYLVSLAIFVVFQNWGLVEVWEDWHENWYCRSQVDEFEESVREVWESVLQLKALDIQGTTSRERLRRIERANERMVDYLIGVRARDESRVKYMDVVSDPEFRAYYKRWGGLCLERVRRVVKEEGRVRVARWVQEMQQPGGKLKVGEKLVDVNLSIEKLGMLSGEDKAKYADAFISKANALYSKRHFSEAEEFYTNYLVLTAPTIAGSSGKAVYSGALSHRARARESLGKLEGAFQDYTTASMLAGPDDLALVMDVGRVMDPLVRKEVSRLMKERDAVLPSPSRVFTFFKSIHLQVPQYSETPSQGDETLKLAFDALQAEDYALSFTLVDEALTQGISWDEGIASALALRGVFRLLCGHTAPAQADLHSAALFSPNPYPATLIILAYTYLALGDPVSALERLDQALRQHPQNADAHYHRRLLLLNDLRDFKEAVEAFDSCIASLRGSGGIEGRGALFELATANLGVGLYRDGEKERSFEVFRNAENDFPEGGEVFMYHAECIRHEERFEEALVKCDKGIEIEKQKRYPDASCLMIKANIISHRTQDFVAMEACYLEALELDAEHAGALDALAQLYARWGQYEEGLEVRKRQVGVVRGKGELGLPRLWPGL